MTSRISSDQANWFRSWIETYEVFPNVPFDHRVVLLHTGTELVDDERFPFQSPSVHGTADESLSSEQAAKVDQILLEASGSDVPCSFALYAGYLRMETPSDLQMVGEMDATWHEGRLNYLLFDGSLREATFESIGERWKGSGTFLELSYLWPHDRSWFVASTPDTAVTVIGCGDTLATRLLAEPVLNAHAWWT